MAKIAPSFLAADFLDLRSALNSVQGESDLLHMDVMDGVFVPNISFGYPVINALSAIATKPMDVHLMITDPEANALKIAGNPAVGYVSFHLNAAGENASSILEQLRAKGVKAGLAINPDIPVKALYPYLEKCDFVVIMGVYAGFGGQRFIPETTERVRELKREIVSRSLNVEIEVDGGVKPDNAHELKEAGADILVAGTAVFKAENPSAVIRAMK